MQAKIKVVTQIRTCNILNFDLVVIIVSTVNLKNKNKAESVHNMEVRCRMSKRVMT